MTRIWLGAALLALGGCVPDGGGGDPDSGDAAPLDGAPALDRGADAGDPEDAQPTDAEADADPADAAPPARPDMSPPPSSPGCGRAPVDALGGVQLEQPFSDAAGGARSFFLSLPPDYDPAAPHRLIIAYAGTNWRGEMIRPYFDFERGGRAGEIYVYPDLLWRDFGPWGELGGWLLGPHAAPADGMDDIRFTDELITWIGERYCVDPGRIFATGHSWGGDMAAVAACFLGDRIRAAAPAAANRPYWFEPREGPVGCVGQAAVWTFFGEADEHFAGSEPYPGAYGDEQTDFWRMHNGCREGTRPLALGEADRCVVYDGCAVDTRYCLYGPASGHQIPAGFAEAVLGWFRGF